MAHGNAFSTAPLKLDTGSVDTLDRMIRITLMDESTAEVSRSEARGVVPFERVLRSSQLRNPIEGIICHKGKPLPLLGPMPSVEDLKGTIDQRPWILLFADHAQVIRGLPDFGAASAKVLPFEDTGTGTGAGAAKKNLLKSA